MSWPSLSDVSDDNFNFFQFLEFYVIADVKCMCTHTHMRTHTHTHTHTHMQIHVHTHARTHKNALERTSV